MTIFYGEYPDSLYKLYEMLNEKGYKLYGIKVVGDKLLYGFLDSYKDFIEHLEKEYSLIPFNSPKYLFHPPYQLLLRLDKEIGSVETVFNDLGDIVLFGIKPCDLSALRILDKLLQHDQYYVERRNNVVFTIVEECNNVYSNCFCGSLGYGPTAVGEYDLAYMVLKNKDNAIVIYRTGSDKGLQLIKDIGFRKASVKHIRKYNKLVKELQKKTSRIPSINVLYKAFSENIGNIVFWEKISRECITCSNCNMVCPTCYCTELLDEIRGEYAYRLRKWIGCLSYTYGLVAGGHFRPKQYMRFRHFILHKFLFILKRHDLIGCVGCGRCITWCPIGIDLITILNKVVEYGIRKTGSEAS